MEPHTWVIGQVIMDIIIALILLWYIRYHGKRQKADMDYHTAILRAEKILSEMDRISKGLERNLEEKKRLSHRILNQLDEGLQGAEECRLQLEKIVRQYIMIIDNASPALKDAGQARQSVNTLLEKGLTKEEIARDLEISLGEIELLLKVQTHEDMNQTRKRPGTNKWFESLPKQGPVRSKDS
ncbi:MAG: hypothetical protein JW932_04070 [Deltaproteobacteria bacterium]|nr:hypothetical protein [Deltaproteobacteria bacterium]